MYEHLIPPQDIEAEKCILGATMIDTEALNIALSLLKPNDFYKDTHKCIFNAIKELEAENTPVDLITVNDKLAQKKMLDIIGGIIYLGEISSGIPTTKNAMHYCNIVKSKSIRREYIKATQDIAMMAYEGNYSSIVDFKNEVMAKMDIEVSKKKLLNSATEIVCKVTEQIQKRFDNKNDDKLFTGLKWFDKQTGGLHAPDLTILAARPSVGKTAVSIQIALNLAKKNNNIAIFNLEMGKTQIIERMICNLGKLSTDKIRNPKSMSDEDWEKFGISANEVSKQKINIFDDIFTLEEIRSQCWDLKNRNELDAVMIDYLQLMTTYQKYNSTNDRVSILSRGAKLLAKELNIPVILLSQLTRKNEHEKRRPLLSDLRDSGAIEQDADNVIFLHDPNAGTYEENNDNKTELEIIIAKQRNGKRDIYKTFDYYKNTQRIYNRGF